MNSLWTFAAAGLLLAAPAHAGWRGQGEFGVVLMVGGNIEGVTRTVSIEIYDDVQSLNYAVAAKTAALLLGISYLVLLGVYGLNRRMWAAWPQK